MKGYPDYFGQNIFQRYGPVEYTELSSSAITDTNYHEIINLDMKGKILEGHISFLCLTHDPYEIVIKISVDGSVLFDDVFFDYLANNAGFTCSELLYLADYNFYTSLLVVGIKKDLYVESNFTVNIKGNEADSNTFFSSNKLFYSNIV